MTQFTSNDEKYMKMALEAAQDGIGKTDFAPCIGCVLVRDDKVIGVGRTSDGGVPHAEDNALKNAREQGYDPEGCTVYVTLEPCANLDPGATITCSDLLLQAKVARVVTCLLDPDYKTNGQGIEKLKAAGIQIDVGLFGNESMEQNPWFYESRMFK